MTTVTARPVQSAGSIVYCTDGYNTANASM